MRLLIIALVVLWPLNESAAATRRVAVIVGNNHGGPGKERLRYAERDARQMSQLLWQLGGIKQVELLLGKSADELRRALATLGRKQQQSQQPWVLLFFYSGHADHEAILMGRSRFPFAELRRTLVQFPAQVVVSFVDACQSGQLTRAKGGRAVPVVDVRFDQGAIKGHIFITSSAQGESAQESDDLRASFFTHYLLSGLRGGADDSGDGKVSLEEVYRFAYRHTLARTTSTMFGPQHPSYQMDLVGTDQFIVTWLSPHLSYLVLPRDALGRFYIYSRSTGSTIAEIHKVERRRLRVALAAGEYEVRQVRQTDQLTGQVRVTSSRETTLPVSRMVRRPLSATGRKGEGEQDGALALCYHLHTGYLDQASLIHGVRGGYLFAVGPLELGGLFGYGYSSYARHDAIQVRVNELTLMTTVQWRGRFWPWLHTVMGLDVGGSWVWQRGSLSAGQRQDQSSPVFRYQARLGVLVPLTAALHFGAWGHLGQVVVQKESSLAAPLGGGLEAGFLYYL